jgi:hypothetical protein
VRGLSYSRNKFSLIIFVLIRVFVGPDKLISCTLLGSVTHHQLSRTDTNGALELTTTWTRNTQALAKVNAISVAGDRIAIGGIGTNEKGIVEVWRANDV